MDPTSLNLATMMVGAILGLILPPFGNAIVGSFFKKIRMKTGLHSALILLFAASALWIVGEMCILIFYTSREAAGPIGIWITLSVLPLATYALVIAYRHLPEEGQKDGTKLQVQHKGPLALFIYGNILWIGGEIIQNFFDYLSYMMDIPFYQVGYVVRLVTSFIGGLLFVIAAKQMRKEFQ